MTAQAEDAMLSGDHDAAIRLYSRLLEDPGFTARRDARERLGLARERKGQLAQARLEYATYLAEFPDGADAERVQQRLAGLAAGEPGHASSRDETLGSQPLWEVRGGVAQYVRHTELELPGTRTAREHSHLASNLNLVVRRHGERFDMLQRIDAAYHYNLLDATESSDPEDQLHVIERVRRPDRQQARLAGARRPPIAVRQRHRRPFRRRARRLPVAARHCAESGARLSRRPSAPRPRHRTASSSA